MPNVLVAGKIHQDGIKLLEQAENATFDYVEDVSQEAFVPHLENADAIVLRTQTLSRELVGKAPRLKMVSRHGVGYDAVDVEALDERQIPLAIVGDVNSATVAEHAMALMLAACRKLLEQDSAMRVSDWERRNIHDSAELLGKTLLIIGYGKIGRRLAGLAEAFGMKVTAHDPFVQAGDFGSAAPVDSLASGLRNADVVSIHAPKSDKPLIGAKELEMMKPGAVLINTSRGGAVDEGALAQALEAGAIGGAGIDVFETEPPGPTNPLLSCKNAVLTPHTAALTRECARRMGIVSVQNALDFFAGKLNPGMVVNLRGG